MRLTGYSNNTDATTQYGSNNGKLVPVPTAYANIKITSGTYKDQTAAIPVYNQTIRGKNNLRFCS